MDNDDLSDPISESDLDSIAEYGFEVTAELTHRLKTTLYEEFRDEFSDFLEERRLVWGGDRDYDTLKLFVGKPDASCSEEDRAAVEAWLEGRDEVEEVEVGPLRDSSFDA